MKDGYQVYWLGRSSRTGERDAKTEDKKGKTRRI